MDITKEFGGKYLKAGDIEADADDNGTLVLTITDVVKEVVGQDGTQKPVVYFEETDKSLVLNKTNSSSLATLYGPRTEEWAGKRVGLFATEVDYAGKQVLAIRVRLRAPKAAAKAKAVEVEPDF